ncbi:MAG: glycine--tRNA ligase subunit beta [Immundisolibacteraceae bacterium]|nr:glycine--tRNA ligase subunit beta [Immundisolibacteraceae bacterium]
MIRIQLEAGLDLPLLPLLTEAMKSLPESVREDSLPDQVNSFILERFRSYQENAGFRHDEIEAVLAVDPQRLADGQARLQALQQFRSNPAAASLAAANKRVANILAKSKDPAADVVDQQLLVEPQEQALYEALMSCGELLMPLVKQREYVAVCQQLAGLRQVVDEFFDAVMVMAEQSELRRNRLALLVQMRQLFLQVADFSCLQG